MDTLDSTVATIEAYNQYAAIYDQEVVDFWENFPKATITAFIKNLSGQQVLNLGSGPGRDAVLLRQAGCDVVCIDGSAAMVEKTAALGFDSKCHYFQI